MQITYEPHPVSPARKAELRAQGFKIIDARFAPAGAEADLTREAVAAMDRASLLDLLAAHGVEDAKGKTADLRATLARIMFVEL